MLFKTLKSFSLVAGVALTLSVQAFAASGDVVSSGELSGLNSHVTTGSVSFVEVENGYLVKLGEGFSLDGAPDPKLALVSGDNAPVILAALESNNGEQTYIVPADVNPADFDTFHIWCEKFSVSLGATELN
jgi:hypothetical protein